MITSSRKATIALLALVSCLSGAADLTTGLAGKWSFENNVLDVSGSNINGTAFGSPTYGTGTNGNAILLGTGKYVDLGTTMPFTNQITVSAWVYCTGPYVASGQHTVFSRFSSTGLILGINDTTGQLRFYVNGSYALSTAGIPLNTWTHVAGVYNGATVTPYINGVAAATPVAVTGNIAFAGNYVIGARSDSTAYNFQGLIDEVVVFRRALSASDMDALRLATLPTIILTNVYLYGKVSSLNGSPLAGVLAWVSNPAATYAGAYSLYDGTFTLPVMQGTNVRITFTPPRGAATPVAATNMTTPFTNFYANFSAEANATSTTFRAPSTYSPQNGDLQVEVLRATDETAKVLLHLVSTTGNTRTRIGDVSLSGRASLITVPADSMRNLFTTGSYILEMKVVSRQSDENDPRNYVLRRLMVIAR